MRTLFALALAVAAAQAVPGSAHACCTPPVVVEIDSAVWVNPGVYVSRYSAVTRDYPYVGCCQPAYENWSLARPYPWMLPARIVSERRFMPHRRAISEPPHQSDHLRYPDGRTIERFIDPPGRR